MDPARRREIRDGLAWSFGAAAIAAAVIAPAGWSLRGASGCAAPHRNPALWPYASDSPWNRPIGSGARYEPIRASGLELAASPSSYHWRATHEVLMASTADPLRVVIAQGLAPVSTHVPRPIHTDESPDHAWLLVHPTALTVLELREPERRAGGHVFAASGRRDDLRGPGLATSPGGVRASGVSAMVGLIRRGELVGGIRHALALRVRPESLSHRGPGGPAWTWPAGAGESYELDPPNAEGNLHLGTLLAIPLDVDLDSLGIAPYGPARNIARALQEYGGYVLDVGEDPLAIELERDASAEVPPDLNADLARILPALRVVADNGPDSPGGGTPRPLRAPPLDR